MLSVSCPGTSPAHWRGSSPSMPFPHVPGIPWWFDLCLLHVVFIKEPNSSTFGTVRRHCLLGFAPLNDYSSPQMCCTDVLAFSLKSSGWGHWAPSPLVPANVGTTGGCLCLSRSWKDFPCWQSFSLHGAIIENRKGKLNTLWTISSMTLWMLIPSRLPP